MIFLRKIFLIILGTSLLLVGVIFLAKKQLNKDRAFYQITEENITRSIDFNQVLSLRDIELDINLANTDELRALGLSYTDQIQENQGMLFIFDIPARYGFWMKDMRYSLDIIWIDEDYKIVDISKNIEPNTYPELFYPQSPVKYVLEVGAGFADRYSILNGDKIMVK